MIYKVVPPDKMNQVENLWDYCFEKKDDPFFQYYFQEYCGKNNTVIGGFGEKDDEECLINMVHVNPYSVRIRGKEQLTPYLVGVATAPEARGQHLFKPLLKATLEKLRSQEVSFVTLMPIFAGIYKPYEFAYYHFRHEYKMSLSALAELGCNTCDVKLERSGLVSEKLAPIYATFTVNCSGVPVRDEFQWKKLLAVNAAENVQLVVASENEKTTGYMFYKITDGTFNAIELIYLTNDAKFALLNFAGQHKSDAENFVWLAPDWDKTYLNFKDQSITGSVAPFMMARCIDARRALLDIAPSKKIVGEVNLLLTDNLVEENNHMLKLISDDGQLGVSSTKDAEDIAMGMAAFTQMFIGTFTATELAEAGLITVKNEEKLELLDKLFPKLRTFNNEYF